MRSVSPTTNTKLGRDGGSAGSPPQAAVLPSAGGLASFFVGDDFDFLVIVRRMRHAGKALELSFWGEWEPLWYLSFYFDYRLWGLLLHYWLWWLLNLFRVYWLWCWLHNICR